MSRFGITDGYKIAKQKVQQIYDCKDCINSIYLDELNCKLKMFEENKKSKSSKVDKAIDCIWYIKRNKCI